jgi:hypothetical protein
MQRLLLLALPSLVLAANIAVQAVRGALRAHPVYSVAAVQAGLMRQPDAWAGRTVWVRGIAQGCGFRAEFDLCPPAALVDAASPATGQPLWLAQGDASPLRTLVRQIPFLARFAPAPQALHWGLVATYRVRVQAVPESICGTGMCSEVALLDAAPDGLFGE